MSRLLALPVAALLLAGCGSSSRRAATTAPPPPSVPVVKEAFTPLPCPASAAARQTTVGLEGCAEQGIVRLDTAINRTARTSWTLLRDGVAKRKFAAAERAWQAYRRASCASVSDAFRGGSGEPVLFAQCVLARDRTHVRELAQFGRSLRATG